MKSTLGKIFFTLLALQTLIFAQGLATYTITTNKKEVVIKEPILLTFVAHQKNHTDHMFFSFSPKESKDYEMHLLEKTIDDEKYHDTTATFRYILFTLTPKPISINFDFIVKTASDKAIRQSFVDDHDDSIAISTNDTKVAISAININVKALKHHVDLVGDFTLKQSIKTTTIKSYEALNLNYTLIGRGYHVQNLELLHSLKDSLSLFSTIENKNTKLTKDGFVIKSKYIYAITAKDDFIIPEVNLLAYSPKKRSYYKLSASKKDIKVEKIDEETLLNKETFPKNEKADFSNYVDILIGIIIFISGFITAKLSEKINLKRKEEGKFDAIKEASSAQALILLLIQKYNQENVKECIDILEKVAYRGDNMRLDEIKKRIITKLK